MKKLLHCLFIALLVSGNVFTGIAQTKGEIITVDNKRIELLSDNLISNSGFEDGFTGWTDATINTAQLSSSNFTIMSTGGVNNSKYLVGTKNESANAAGSIGTGWAIEANKTYYFSYQVKYQDATAAAGTEDWLKVSLTKNKVSSSEPFVLLGSANVGAGGKWTQNYVIFTNSQPYSYIVSRFRWLNGRFGFDDFALYEAKVLPNVELLQTTIDEALAIYKVGSNGAVEFNTAITTAQSYLTSESAEDVENAIVNLTKAIVVYKYANASSENPLDMTHYITNPGFDDNTNTGWTGAGVINYHEVEFYEKLFDMYQEVKGLPAGKYRLKAQGFERPKSNDSGAAYKAGTETIYARFYAKTTSFSEKKAPFRSLYQHPYTGTGSANGYINTMAAAEKSFATEGNFEITLDDILLNEGGTIIIGAKSDFKQTGYWTLFDNFRLEYIGAYDASDLIVAANDRIVEAQSLLTGKIQKSVVNDVNATIAQLQEVIAVNPPVLANIETAKGLLDTSIEAAYASRQLYTDLQTAIDYAAQVLEWYSDEPTKKEKLETAINTSIAASNNFDQTSTQIRKATSDLNTVVTSVDKKTYTANWSMGDVTNVDNNWSLTRTKKSKNWILFWEKGYGENPTTFTCGSYTVNIDDVLKNAEIAFNFYTDSLKFINKGSSKTDTYRMVIRLRYATEWEASGSGVDNLIGLLTLTPWAASSRDWQTTYHEVGHCFQYQVHCDNGDYNGWMYAVGKGSAFWEQCAQWQAYKIMPSAQFGNEWFSGYLSNVHKEPLHEAPRYNNYFIQDYWTYRQGMDIIAQLWNKCKDPEDAIQTYKRITNISQEDFNDEMFDCAARFTTWDIPALRSYGANYILSRPTPKMNKKDDNYWQIDSTVCIENYGHNIIRLNVPKTTTTVSAYFEGMAGVSGFRKKNISSAGWRYGFVSLLTDGTRVYSDMGSASYNIATDTLRFECPADTKNLWLVVSGAPSAHWTHLWDDNDSNDEQWPYQVKFNNTNRYGFANIVDGSSISKEEMIDIKVYISGNELKVDELSIGSIVRVFDITGRSFLNIQAKETSCSTVLPSGIYVINVTSANGNYSRKVIIK